MTKKLSQGLTTIDQEEEKYLESNKILREDAEKVTATVKRAHPVFKSLTVVDGGDTWDYDYVASTGRIKEGPQKAEGNKEKAERLGGAYKDIPANGGEVHHMPADSIRPLSKERGPAIRMDTLDHRMTKSWGGSKKAIMNAQLNCTPENNQIITSKNSGTKSIQSRYSRSEIM